jgi:hypothetical protein
MNYFFLKYKNDVRQIRTTPMMIKKLPKPFMPFANAAMPAKTINGPVIKPIFVLQGILLFSLFSILQM